MKTIEGLLSGEKFKIGIISSRFNSFIVERLAEGSIDCLTRHGVKQDNIELIKVPGAFEIPATLSMIVENKKDYYDGIICLGAVIRGETPHFDFIASEVTKGIAQVSLKSPIPISFGILTTDSIEQAVDRAGTKSGNKGFEAALSLLEMINLFKVIQK